MTLPVLIESNPAGGFTAKLGPPFELSFDGISIADATAKIETALVEQEASGRVVFIEYPKNKNSHSASAHAIPNDPIHSLLDDAESLPDDDLTREWMQIMKENRIQHDLDDERLGREW